MKTIACFNVYNDKKVLPCGYTVIGNDKKREMVVRMHVKKCEMCKMFPKSELSKLQRGGLNLRDTNYLSYVKGEYARETTLISDVNPLDEK
jgi:hypothetical protein